MRFQLSRQIKAGLILSLLINVLASTLSETRIHDTSLTPRVAGPVTGKAGASKSGAGEAVAGKSGSEYSGSTGPRLGIGTGSNTASGDKSESVPHLGMPNTGKSSSEVKTTVEQIRDKLPSGWKLMESMSGKGIKSELPSFEWLQERINLADKEWVHWTMGELETETERMTFFINPQLRAIIRYDAKLVENRVPLLNMKGRDIIMAAWATMLKQQGYLWET